MERRRIEYQGAFYHVTQRGNNRENIFRREADKSRYLSSLVELKKKYDFKLFGYVLMDNHYHLLLQAGQDPLHKIIFRQNMQYSRYFNKTHNRSGHLYGDRYKAALIQDEHYLFAVLCYIHWNPVKAGISRDVTQYQWSSDACYRRNLYGTVDIDFILNILSADRKSAIFEYARLMLAEEDIKYDSLKIIGDQDFEESLKKDETSAGQEKSETRKSLDEILEGTGVSDEDYQLIKGGSRKRRLAPYKTAYIKEAVRQGYSFREIGGNISISASAVALY
ncbi:MAG TPA: transposase [Candidatus Limnocylindrales bacterium]|nr:transposase [Candidatus Limnocylindrales bacterium]